MQSKVITIIGTRPQLMKVDTELPGQKILWTGQHYSKELSDELFDELGITPDYNLECRSSKVGRMIDKIGGVLRKEKPNLCIVIGDTNSTLAGAIAAAYQNIPIVHIESGLRSGRMDMPEEINRLVADRLATVRICPNSHAEMNLLKEGIKDNVYTVGDPESDAMYKFIPLKRTKNYMKYNLVTIHRNFNTDNEERLRTIIEALGETDMPIILPMHPRTVAAFDKFKIKKPRNFKVIPPQGYKAMLTLTANANKVITDSGGVQRESSWLGIPVIILRNETEWGEIIAKKSGILVDADKDKIKDAVANFKCPMYTPPEKGVNKKIRDIIYKYV